MIRNAVLSFYGGDPVVAITLTFALASILGVAVNVFWQRRQERKRRQKDDQDRRRLGAAIELSNYPPKPSGSHSTPWKDRRAS